MLAIFMYLISAIVVSAQASAIDVTVDQLANGQANVVLRNNSAVPLTAYVITSVSDVPSAKGVGTTTSKRDWDAATTRAQRPLPANGQTTLTLGAPGATNTKVQFHAGIFEDGRTFGDPDWVDLILQRRGYLLQDMDAALKDLQSASTGGLSQEALVQQLTASRDAKRAEAQIGYKAAMAEAIAKDAMRQLYVEPTQALKKANLRVLSENDRGGSATEVYLPLLHAVAKPPAKSDGSPMPLTEVVKLLINRLNQNRADLLNSKPAIPAR